MSLLAVVVVVVVAGLSADVEDGFVVSESLEVDAVEVVEVIDKDVDFVVVVVMVDTP